MADSTVAVPATSRRSFLNLLLGVGLLAWLGSIVHPVIRYLKPLAATGPGGPIKLTTEELAKLDKDKFLILRAGTSKILVFQDGTSQVRALNAKCTHEGCTVQFVPGDSVIWCACHNGRFDLDGRVLAGPPPRPLSRYTAQRGADGSVTVTPEVA